MPLSRAAQFRNRANVGLLSLAFVVIVVTSLVSARSTNDLSTSIGLVNHTIEVKEALTELQVKLGMLESDGLRYMIAGTRHHREGLHRHLDGIRDLLPRLKALIDDNPRQMATFSQLSSDFRKLQQRAEASVKIKEAELLAGTQGRSLARLRDGEGENLVDRLREQIFSMSREEDRLLQIRAQARDALVKQTNATLMIANGLALVAGLLGFFALRRAQREAENALLVELFAAQAKRASDEKSVFLANVSHEIRTPMNAIFGFAQLLSDHVREPLQREWVMSIRKSGQILLALINDVLDLSKIEAGKVELDAQGTDLAELAAETLALFEPMAETKGLQLSCEIEKEGFVPVVVDAQRLRQILMNLLSNAVKYTERGSISLRMAMMPSPLGAGHDLRIQVTDTGVGIALEEQAEIFEPFHQAESPDGRVRQGTGLGLSITMRLVHLMHGRIHVESRPGQGAMFGVDIPDLAPATDMSSVAHEVRVDFDRLPPLKVLVVDDVQWNVEVAKGYLSGSHHQVVTAVDGVEGLQAARRLRPDVVLMDLRMPRMNGYRAFEAIRADASLAETRVIAVTASTLTSEETAQNAQFDGYIRKPYAPDALFEILSGLFGSRAAAPPQVAPSPAVSEEPHTDEGQAEALAEWRSLCGEPLQVLRERMRIREIDKLSKRLVVLADRMRDPTLQALTARLRLAVQLFDVSQVKSVLDALAHHCEEDEDAP